MRLLTIVLGLFAALTLVASAFAGMNVLEYQGGDQGKVIFDGKAHNAKLGPGKCMECHKGNVPFAMKKPDAEGSIKIKKEDHVAGKYCGTCHDGSKEVGGVKVFGWQEGSDCTKCHKKAEVPAPEQPKEPAPEQPAK
jgi:c(7)-type cytochrome triheme protein